MYIKTIKVPTNFISLFLIALRCILSYDGREGLQNST